MAFKYTVRKDGRLVKKVIQNGKPIYLYSNNKDDLYNQYIEVKYKIQNNQTINKSSLYFKDYAEEWVNLNLANKELSTQNSIKNRIKHINEYIGNIKLSNIKPNDIQRMVTELTKKGYKDLTNRSLMDCRRILENAVQNDYIEKNPANGIDKIKYQKSERQTLTIEEDKKVIELALKHKYGLFILLLRFCGLRPEECVALTLNDIDLKNKTISINKAVSLAKNQPQVKATKNLKNRVLPIPDFLIDNLKIHIASQRENGSQFLFTKEKDKLSMWSKQALKTHLKTFLNDLNKNSDNKIHFTYYVLRHSYCTMLYYAGIKVKSAQLLMGHSSAKMVYDIYTHLDEQRENSSNSINNYINNTY